MHESGRKNGAGHRLVRVDGNGTMEEVGTFPTFEEGWSEGQRRTHDERDHAFRLYEGKRSVARFGFSRLMPRFDGDRTAQMVEMIS